MLCPFTVLFLNYESNVGSHDLVCSITEMKASRKITITPITKSAIAVYGYLRTVSQPIIFIGTRNIGE